MTPSLSSELIGYHASGKPLVCELDANPYLCEFWPQDKLAIYNAEYQVPEHAPGFFGFATNGGGEMLAMSPDGSVVCIPFVGMAPSTAVVIAPSFSAFMEMLRDAL